MIKVYLAIALLSSAALLGSYLLSRILMGKETPKGVTFMHGPLAGAGLIALILASHESGWTSYLGQIFVFILVAIGGIIMIAIDLTGHKVPKKLGLAHGLVAVTGFIWLVTGVL